MARVAHVVDTKLYADGAAIGNYVPEWKWFQQSSHGRRLSHQARAQLDQPSATHLGDERDALRAGLGTAPIGVAVGGVLAATALALGHPVVLTLTCAAYGLVLVLAILWMLAPRTSRGHARTYRTGFLATMAPRGEPASAVLGRSVWRGSFRAPVRPPRGRRSAPAGPVR